MKILCTGSNGFLGKNIIPILSSRKHIIKTLSTRNADYTFDIRKQLPAFSEKFDIVFHAAGKAHSIPRSKEDEKEFFDVNFEGTKNVCLALENNLPEVFIFVSTVAVYGRDSGENINENESLLGNTPYAKSKILAEQFLQNWSIKNNVKLFILRPSLIAGPNPPGNLGDMINAIDKRRYFNIAGGKARKSVIWVDDFADLIENSILKKGGIYNVCDSIHPSFRMISNKISLKMHRKIINIPYFIAKLMALVGEGLGNKAPINLLKLNKIVKSLTFDNTKLIKEFGFKPSDTIKKL
ncbi:nucleoside-diphosphate-sugar epimerase [Elizabethkingia sp. YR214]|uniref:NAD-dependent epimerase/dehydratase family protein n=1 Tax=Elizabethkingia sp. YR214 TaxID=2135667 RepID=UPI000D2FC622|nr:NAD-dependent epimerase/dehydratase family protein [Elizabethkingia sp. YR214]PUB28540.1 nucleoside-diphosphate-sugar epimerase [Elizabethkingia sp. YR214]